MNRFPVNAEVYIKEHRKSIGKCVINGGYNKITKKQVKGANGKIKTIEISTFMYMIRITISNIDKRGAKFLENKLWLAGRLQTCLYALEYHELEAIDNDGQKATKKTHRRNK